MSPLGRAFYDAVHALGFHDVYTPGVTTEIVPNDQQKHPKAITSEYEKFFADVFNGASNGNRVVILDAGMFKEGKTYHFTDGLLIVNGDLPPRVTLLADHAKVYVDGSVGKNSTIKVEVPQNFETRIEPIPSAAGIAAAVEVRVPKEFIYPEDKDPGLIVTGSIAQGVDIFSNARAIVLGDCHASAGINLSSGAKQFGFANDGIDKTYINKAVNRALRH